MSGRIGCPLEGWKRVALAVTTLATVAAPMAIGLVSAPSLRAQSLVVGPDGKPRPKFEVTSVKAVDVATMTRDHEGRQLTRTKFVDRTELMAYIARAYVRGGGCDLKVAFGEDCPVIVGTLPTWVKTDRFEIQGTMPPNTPGYSDQQVREGDTRQVNLMLQVLLEDRFHLKAHRETRDMPVYAVRVGRNALKLNPPTVRTVKGPDGTPFEIHGISSSRQSRAQDGSLRRQMNFQASSMQQAADQLSVYFDRPVVDQTGIKGEYDFTVETEVDSDAPRSGFVPNPSGRGGNYFNPYTGLTPSELSRALRDLGLQLDSTKAPVELLVIDHVERPSEN